MDVGASCTPNRITTNSMEQRERGWLGHCSSSREVTVSITDGVIGIFY